MDREQQAEKFQEALASVLDEGETIEDWAEDEKVAELMQTVVNRGLDYKAFKWWVNEDHLLTDAVFGAIQNWHPEAERKTRPQREHRLVGRFPSP